jgi:putative adhesin
MLATALVALMAITQTDQTTPVQKGIRLDVQNFAGEVVVKVWDKDAVRVQAEHSDRMTVDIRQTDQALVVRSHSRTGPPRSLDYTITVPAWMPVSVSGNYTDVTMEGVGGDVTIETVRGDVTVRGGSGTISLKSVQGEIVLEKAKGHIDIRAVNQGIKLADVTGDLTAETVNGSIILDRIDSTNVDLYTVNGNVSYDGPIHDKGTYRLTTHDGVVGVAVPDRTNATILVRTYNGGFRASFPVKTDTGDDDRRRKKFSFVLGNGSAHVELESFGGTIVLRRPGERTYDRGDPPTQWPE